MFTQVRSANRRVSPADVNGRAVMKAVYLVLEPQYQNSLTQAATSLNDLRIPPGNRLQALKGNRQGQHSIRINDQYRLCFRWADREAYEIEITDYH